jgi:two-component system chemotaxis response regulator CheB
MRVLIVDDSAVVREILSQLLAQDRRISVATSPDPVVAFEKIKRERPDVIITDLEMPRMDGLAFVRTVMRTDPIPIIVCSGAIGPGTERALQALAEGAIEIITKPKFGVREFLHDSAQQLLQMVWEVAGSSLAHIKPRLSIPNRPQAIPYSAELRTRRPQLIAIGASTGGPEAIREILQEMPENCPGIVIVQHMPAVFTRAFADHLNRDCSIQVKEAEHGDRVLSGWALVAPGNRHLLIGRNAAYYEVEINDEPPVGHHRPSIDLFFNSVANAAGRQATGVLLTGMGRDGAAGLLEMRRAGSTTIAQDETTSVVFGMPAEAIILGAAQQVLRLNQIAPAVLQRNR